MLCLNCTIYVQHKFIPLLVPFKFIPLSVYWTGIKPGFQKIVTREGRGFSFVVGFFFFLKGKGLGNHNDYQASERKLRNLGDFSVPGRFLCTCAIALSLFT